MTSRARTLTASAATVAGAAVAIALVVLGRADPSPAANPRAVEGAVQTSCAQQSGARFPGAYRDRRNLVVGPLALIGGATFTSAATARRFHGNKYPVLVRPGHTVTVSVPERARRTASLGYGPLPQNTVLEQPDGHHTVMFVACSSARVAASTAGGPVTFWSGFILVSEPSCVPLDVYLDDDARPRRVRIELGRRCSEPPTRDCSTHVEGPGPIDTKPPPGSLVVGPLSFAGLRSSASRRGLALHRARGGYGVKAGVGVPAGVRATLSIARNARSWAALQYARRVPGKPWPRSSAVVRFEACAADHPAFSYDGPVGPITGFSGGVQLKRPGCLPLEVRVAGQPVVRARVPFGVGQCR
jgi:hypothetical protein